MDNIFFGHCYKMISNNPEELSAEIANLEAQLSEAKGKDRKNLTRKIKARKTKLANLENKNGGEEPKSDMNEPKMEEPVSGAAQPPGASQEMEPKMEEVEPEPEQIEPKMEKPEPEQVQIKTKKNKKTKKKVFNKPNLSVEAPEEPFQEDDMAQKVELDQGEQESLDRVSLMTAFVQKYAGGFDAVSTIDLLHTLIAGIRDRKKGTMLESKVDKKYTAIKNEDISLSEKAEKMSKGEFALANRKLLKKKALFVYNFGDCVGNPDRDDLDYVLNELEAVHADSY